VGEDTALFRGEGRLEIGRCRYQGIAGMERWVGLGVSANSLLVLGRAVA
jgi:hypothetical protein